MIRRLAGALLLTLAGAPSPTVLMIQRPRSMRHFPGVWSFPGGLVEASDRGGARVGESRRHRDVALPLHGELPPPLGSQRAAHSCVVAAR